MDFECVRLIVEENQIYARIVFVKGKENLITFRFLDELNAALDIANNLAIKIVILEGTDDVFCNGLSFKEIKGNKELCGELAKAYSNTLYRLISLPQVIISKVNGNVSAGGLGIVAASDFAIAKEDVQFCLTELMWGLLPATIASFLIRKVGVNAFNQMALTGKMYTANEALAIGLISKISNKLEFEIKRSSVRIGFYSNNTIERYKKMVNIFAPIDEKVRERSVEMIVDVMNDEEVKENIRLYVDCGKYPWEK